MKKERTLWCSYHGGIAEPCPLCDSHASLEALPWEYIREEVARLPPDVIELLPEREVFEREPAERTENPPD